MTALDLVRRIRANPKGSDFQDVKHVEEFVRERVETIMALGDLTEAQARFMQQRYFELYPAAKPKP